MTTKPKQLLIETIQIYPSQINKADSGHYIVESTSGGKLVVVLPATTCDKKNLNERIYSSTLMEGVTRKAKTSFENRELLSSVNEHPSEPYVTPGQASHVVTDAWVKDGTFYNKWEVLETAAGKDLRALIEAKVAFGVSIRGVGSVDYQGNILEDYEFLGCDCVAEPSAQLRVRPETVKESTTNTKSIFNKESKMSDKKSVISYLSEQKVLMENELKSDRVAAFTRAAAVEGYLSESKLTGKDIADVYQTWESIKEGCFKPLSENKDQLNEDTASLLRKTLEKRTTQLKTMSKGITQIAEQLKLTKLAAKGDSVKVIAEAQSQTKVVSSQLTKALTYSKRLAMENRRVKIENAKLLRAATIKEVAYRLSVKEAAKLNVAYKIAVKEAAKLAKGKRLIIVKEAKQKMTESMFSFFTDTDYDMYAGAAKPFGKMEPMIAEGSNYQVILAGTDGGTTQIQMFMEDGAAFAKDVASWNEFYDFAIALPESTSGPELKQLGFTDIGGNFGESKKTKSFKVKAAQKVVESKKVIDNSKSQTLKSEAKPAQETAYSRGEHAFKGWI